MKELFNALIAQKWQSEFPAVINNTVPIKGQGKSHNVFDKLKTGSITAVFEIKLGNEIYYLGLDETLKLINERKITIGE